MAKTTRLRLDLVADWHNVAWAMHRAFKGKRDRPDIRTLLRTPEPVIALVSESLRQGRLPVGAFSAFTIHDPKRRLIHAAPLPDRIAHHALVRFLEPTFERVLLPSVFACRTGKGVDAAIRYAQRQARRFPWVMHLDMDDFLVWSHERQTLLGVRDRFAEYLEQELELRFKPPLVQRSERGILFCGVHIKPHGLRSSRRRRKRYRKAVDYWERQWRFGRIDSLQLQRAHDAARAILLPADDLVWRRNQQQARVAADA